MATYRHYPASKPDVSEDLGDISSNDECTHVTVKAKKKHIFEILWKGKREIMLKMRVFTQHQLMYKADFVSSVDVVKVLHPRMKIKGDGQVISQSFKVDGLGKVLLTFDSSTKKKALLVYKCCRKPVQI